jgi:hypothetical protein
MKNKINEVKALERELKIEEIERGMVVIAPYNGSKWAVGVKSLSKKTGYVIVEFGDYMDMKIHCSQLEKELTSDE